jgi:hypothetical protein
MKLASDPFNPAKFPLRGPRRGCFAPHPPALRRTLTVTITPVTFASGAAAPGRPSEGERCFDQIKSPRTRRRLNRLVSRTQCE